MISIGIIECTEVLLDRHMIFIGIHTNTGGIGHLTTLLIMDSTIGIH